MKDNDLNLATERSRRYPTQTIMDADYVDDIAFLANTLAQAWDLLTNPFHVRICHKKTDFERIAT